MTTTERLRTDTGVFPAAADEPARPALRLQLAAAAAVAVVYAASALLAYQVTIREVVTLWAPSGVLLGVLLSSGTAWWPAIVAGAYAGNIAADLGRGVSLGPLLSAPLVNMIESVVAALVVRRLARGASVLRSLRGVASLVLGAAILSNAATAFLGGLSMQWNLQDIAGRWLNWWVGDGLGIIVVAPAVVGLLEVWKGNRARVGSRAALESLALVAAIVVIGLLTFDRAPGYNRFLATLAYPVLIWTALRLGAEAAAIGVCLFSGVVLWFSQLGLGPLVAPGLGPLEQALEIYAFLALVSVSVLICGAALAEHEAAAERARESEASYRTLVETAQDAIITVDANGVIQLANPAVRRLLGYEPDRLRGRAATELLPPREAERIREWMARHEAGSPEPPHAFELLALHRDGREIPVELVLGSWKAGDREFHTGILRDVSERYRAERQRGELQRRLAQAEKLESIGRLAGGVAHDFNNTLTVILGNTDEAVAATQAGTAVRLHLADIRKAAERSAELVRQLLGFARRQLAAPALLDLNDRIGQLVGLLSRLIGEEIQFEWRPGRAAWPVRIDPTQVDQIVTNLCINARDAITGAGRITLSTANVSISSVEADADSRLRPGDFVVLTVTDTGTGLGPEALAHLFEPFFTTKAVGKGTGLGLATVYGIVEQNHGFIVVDSEPGRGATFRVHFERHLGQVEPPPVDETVPLQRSGHQTVLIVEDETSILTLASGVLTRSGYTVLQASTPGEALRIAGGDTQIDVLVTDVVMPEMNGRELATRLKAGRPALKLLFTSGYSADIIADRGVLPHQASFLAKPYSPRALLAKVQALLEEEGSARR